VAKVRRNTGDYRFCSRVAISSILFLQFAAASFNHFYFLPHKAYPYPYSAAQAAEIAIWRDCGLTSLAVFAILDAVQRRFVAARRTEI
jgi:hypothetical protein